MRNHVMIGFFVALLIGVATPSSAQPRLVTIAGSEMRVWTQGIEQRRPGQPVMALEAGSGADLDTWKPVFDEIAKLGPVVAYDRLGLGQSAADPKTPTLSRNVETLHDVLHAIAPPPYVLIGHSLGGVIIRGFADRYPEETVGMVYLDVPDFEATREERAAVLADRLRGDGGAMVRLQIRHQMEWTLASPNSLFTIAGHSGHQVHRDDPALVMATIRHVFERASK
jgi:alpha-beta hydrolase superfamily lysophospholipase